MSDGTEKRAKIAIVIWSEQLAEYRARFADFMRGAALGRYEQELRQQTAELNDLFLLLCFMEATALPNPATLYLLEIYPYLLEQFHDWLMKNDYTFTEAEWTGAHDWVKRFLKRELYMTAFNMEDAKRVQAESDPEVLMAIDLLPKARALQDTSRKAMVQRMEGQQRLSQR